MSATAQESLFEPSGSAPLASAVDWIGGVLLGPIALGLCVLAVAFVGALMLTGRLPLRRGLRVVVSCFVLLGAPAIAGGIINAISSGTPQQLTQPAQSVIVPSEPPGVSASD